MINISRESEINLINILIDQDIISGKDLANIKKISTEGKKSQLDAVFELELTDEDKILDLLVKEQSFYNYLTVDRYSYLSIYLGFCYWYGLVYGIDACSD